MGLNWLRRGVSPAMAALLVLEWAVALHGGQRGTGSRGASAGTVRQPPPVLSGSDRRGAPMLFITGAVVQEDGTPALTPARVECVCSARTKRSAALDSRGFFSLQISGSVKYSTLTPDANEESTDPVDLSPNRAGRRFGLPAFADSMSGASLMGCELRATLEGFRSNTVVLQGLKSLGQLDVGTIVLYPIAKVPGTLVSVTSLQAPKNARKALERGGKSFEKRDFKKAKQEFEIAVQAYPKYAEAWFALGQIYEQERHIQDSHDAYQKALGADSNYVKPYIGLARLAGMEQRWKEVADITDHALALDPLDFPEAYYLNSVAHYIFKQLDAAERSARKVLRLDPLHHIPEAYLILADILEQKQELTGSIDQLRSYLRILPNAPWAESVREKIKVLEHSLGKGE